MLGFAMNAPRLLLAPPALGRTILGRTILGRTVPCCTVLWCTVLWCIVLCSPALRAQSAGSCTTSADGFRCCDGAQELCIAGDTPAAGLPLAATITVVGDDPRSGTLFHRPTGAPRYDQRSLAFRQTASGVFSAEVELAAGEVTARGLEAYIVTETLTLPDLPSPAAAPQAIPVLIGEQRAEADLEPRTYRMVSVPADLGPRPAVDVLSDDFGEPDALRWRLLRWNPGRRAYDEATGPSDTFADGAAYWVAANRGGSFDISAATSTNPDSLPAIVLAPGYNQIGNPYAFPVAWDDVRAANGRAEAEVGPLLAYDGGSSYLETGVLRPWTGYFVENRTGQAVRLGVPAREGAAGRPSPRASYAVHLSGRSGSYRDTLNTVGFAAEAEPGRDETDLAEPPPVGEHVRLSLLSGGERWLRDLRPPAADGAVWDVEVTATDGLLTQRARAVTIDLTEAGVRPPGFGLWVLDRDLGVGLDLAGGAVEVTLRRSEPVRRLRVIVGTEAFARAGSEGAPLVPVAFALDAGFPNPFAEQTTLRYHLAVRGEARLEVFDTLGRRVRVLAEGTARAGAHTAVWDGRDGVGRPVASGVYLVRLRAGDASVARRVSVLR